MSDITPPQPIPSPLPKGPFETRRAPVYQVLCRYCNKTQIRISYEQISDSIRGHSRHRYVAREVNTDEIHDCKHAHINRQVNYEGEKL